MENYGRRGHADANGSERSVTVLLATKNRGLRANRQMVR